ncbi:hypothetical protein LINGRAHAP2_LOCUS3553 [Linum grandiflorum]
MAGQRRKPAKRRKTTADTTEEQTTAADRISDLPEDILITILTAADLETRTVIQTSVFSRSWRNLWKSVLATKLLLAVPNRRCISIAEAEQKRSVAFLKGVLSFRNRVYSSHSDGLDVLSVTVTEFMIVSGLLRRIFAHGLAHRARTLRLVALYSINKLPPGLTDMWRLVQNLEISYWVDSRPVVQRERWWKFLAFKTLRLYQCVFGYSWSRRFYAMTNLTDLEVIECKFLNSFTISCDTLVRLVLVYPKELRLDESRVTIFAPNLKSFTSKGLDPVRFVSSEFSSLECLDIDVQLEEEEEEEEKKRKASLRCFRMLRKCCKAERVKLHPNVITALTRFPDILEKEESPFKRMQCLQLHDSKSVLPSREAFKSLISYFFDLAIPKTAHLDRIFAADSSDRKYSGPVVVRKNDLISLE